MAVVARQCVSKTADTNGRRKNLLAFMFHLSRQNRLTTGGSHAATCGNSAVFKSTGGRETLLSRAPGKDFRPKPAGSC